MPVVSDSPPRAPPIKYIAPLGTRWDKEKAAAGGAAAFDLPTDPKNIGPWILGECVGKGASGRVKIARHRRTGQLAAVKILPIAPLVSSRASLATQQAKYDKQRLGIDREITMMKLMNHPNIMRIYDVFEGDQELFLVLEYVEGGELFDFLVNRGRLPPKEALIYFRQIVYGLNYAHTFSIIHRDLKPENILIASLQPPLIKIADWGMAAFAPPTLQLETSCGSPHYASPEIVNGEKYQGNATDIWSCGVILYALLTGRLPFDDKNVRTLLSKVKSGKYEMPNWIDPLAQDLLGRMLIVDVNKRITVCNLFFVSFQSHRPTGSKDTADSISSLVTLAYFDSLPIRRWRYDFCSGTTVTSFPKHSCSSHYFPRFDRFRAFYFFAYYLGTTHRPGRGIYSSRSVRTCRSWSPC
jgi:serine/threonine protein kinase